MPYHCVVPRCRANYDPETRITVFRFPKEEKLKLQWISAIPRSNLKVTKISRVCKHHFKDTDILGVSSACDTKTGAMITAKLPYLRLKEGAVPSIFPGCPSYLSKNQASRQCPAEKRNRMENQQFHSALQESLETKEEEDNKFEFSNYSEFLKCIDDIQIPTFWSVVRKGSITLFIAIGTEVPHYVKCCVSVNENLEVSAYIGSTEVTVYKKDVFPVKIHDFCDFLKILDYIESLIEGKDPNLAKCVSTATQQLLSNLKVYFPENEIVISFLSDQVKLLSCDKVSRRYTPETLIHSTLLYSISPHGYNFIRHSEFMILPHPRTIQKISSSYHANPHYEQIDVNFLKYAKEKFSTIEAHERIVTLMMDEIHIKDYFDYKGGNVVGMAFDSNVAATSAHVFMINSLLSSYKDVVHILPVKSITADILHSIVKKIILGLEQIGFCVICVVSDNNSINRKAMSIFMDPNEISYVYQHPNDASRPLFFIIDSVHIFKCIRNNWINQRNHGHCMFYPDFDTFSDKVEIKTAAFDTLRRLYEIEKNQLITYNRSLTYKALYPSSFERMGVKLVQDVFNKFVITALPELGNIHNLQFSTETAKYIELIYTWWCIMNVKSSKKGERYRNDFMKPLTCQSDDKCTKYLRKFLEWLDAWKNSGCTTGILTRETHQALSQTTCGLLEMSEYCIEELGFKYFLCGKVQTDALEARFGKYRYLSGSQYHVSIRQIFESESKLRLQHSLPLAIHSNSFGSIPIQNFNLPFSWDEIEDNSSYKTSLNVSDEDLEADENSLPVLTYLTGYCVHAVCKHLKCTNCLNQLTIDKDLVCDDDMYCLISHFDLGGLKFPTPDALIVVHYCYVVVKKLLSAEHENEFLRAINQRMVVVSTAFHIISNKEFYNSFIICSSNHTAEFVVKRMLWIACNIFLKNYVIKRNDKPVVKKAPKRKLETLKPSNSSGT